MMESEMANERSREKLLEFLDYMADKGLMAKATISARKAATGKVLGILSGTEADDVTVLDLNDVMKRFQNLEGKGYTPTSLTTYLSRTKSAVDDFKSYLENPLAFRPSVQVRAPRKPEAKRTMLANEQSDMSPVTVTERAPARPPFSDSILPIQIRAETTVFVQGLPYDLTDAEAAKIANVVKAHVLPK
jgi:site-specific recombinase XerC